MEQMKEKNRTVISVNLKRRQSISNYRQATIYLQVICHRKVRQISLPHKVYENEWDESSQQVIVPPNCLPERYLQLIEINQKTKEEKHRILTVIDRLPNNQPITADMIIEGYKTLLRGNTFSSYIEQVIKQFAAENRNASVRHYRSLHNSFLDFLPTDNILLNDIDEELVKKYESWMIARKLHPNTISFYMRYLKALWNRAVDDGIIEARPTPFKHINTGIGKSTKKAVDVEVIYSIERLKVKKLSDKIAQARLFFLFCYYAQGMAFIDLAHLTDKNIQGDYLLYTRHKTGERIRIKLLPVMKKIIRHVRQNKEGFLFPILSGPNASYKEYEMELRLYNGYLKKLGKLVNAHLSSYVPRHSWATHIKALGVPDDLISKGMGHTSVKTTHIYIDLTKCSILDIINKKLIMGKHRNIKGI